MDHPAEEFEQHRKLLLGLAYRLLGSMWDAEDIVQDAYLRWMRPDHADIREPRAFLIKVVSRLALDRLRLARQTREEYPGPWLPEPVSTEALGPLDTAELRDTVSYATLHMMERLSPPERAVFILREAFSLSYDDVSEILGASASACRQMHHRSRRRLEEGRDRFRPQTTEHGRLLSSFLHAAQTGDLTGLSRLLSQDVAVWNDGGGKVRAALRPIIGRDKVLTFMSGLLSRYPLEEVRVVDYNGESALWTNMAGGDQFVAIDTEDGHIRNIFAVLNPDKLSHTPKVTR